jgi:cytochrome c peroxidase
VSAAQSVPLVAGFQARRSKRWLALLAGVLASCAVAAMDMDQRALARLRQPPLGLPAVPVPADNPPTTAKIALGRKLFFDRRLSHNRTMSCAMCHIPEQGFTNNEVATPVGVKGRSLPRNAPTVLNVAYETRLFHDARETSLENQVLSPLLAREEMANPSVGYLIETITSAPDYDGQFEQAFGAPADVRNIGQALASYQRTLVSANAPFDRWYFGGDADALSLSAQRGFKLFMGKSGCVQCHSVGGDSVLFTDQRLHVTGAGRRPSGHAGAAGSAVTVELVPGVVTPVQLKPGADSLRQELPDTGRMAITHDPADQFAFKTPGLRNVALTAPYMHDGSLETLEAVVRFYRAGGGELPGRDPLLRPLTLDAEEIADLVAFLESLTGDNVAELINDARSEPIGN